ETFLTKATQNDPESISTKINLAKVYILLWKLPEAKKICDFLEKKEIDDPDLDLIRADISLMANETLKAEKYYRNAVTRSKDTFRALMKLAIFLKSSNRNEEASEIVQIVQKNNSLPSQISLLSADYYLLDNQYEKAEACILDAIKTEPEDISLKYNLVRLYLAQENNKKAEEVLESISANQHGIYHRLMVADVHILNNEFDKAEKIISELKKEISEPLADFELLQGKFWLYTGKAVYAAAHFKAALELKPGLLNAQYLLGITHVINGKVKLSENSLTGALLIFPNHYKSLLLISELLYKKKEYSLSLSYLERMLELYPEDFAGRIIKGLNLIGQEKYDLAKDEFIKSRYLSKNKAFISDYYLGLIEELSGRYNSAAKYYQKVLDINPELIDVADRYCNMLLKTEQKKAAEDFIRQKLSTGQESSGKYYLAGKVSLLIGRKSEGEAFLKKAMSFQDAQGQIYIELADYYKNIGEFEKAIALLKECIINKPDFAEAWIELSGYYINRMEMTLALETMQAGYQKFQEHPAFQSNLAWLLLENQQDIDKALEIAHGAYEKNPESVAIADTLGWAYYQKEIYSQAVWILSEAQKKDPNNGFVQYHLGMTYYQLGEIEKAVKYLKSAVQFEESKFFLKKIDDALSKMSNEKPAESETNKFKPVDESILSSPQIDKKDDIMIVPQWRQ
ncbi:MAG: tetratricopeptide repeat protein, partial [Desulfobacula sp.]